MSLFNSSDPVVTGATGHCFTLPPSAVHLFMHSITFAHSSTWAIYLSVPPFESNDNRLLTQIFLQIILISDLHEPQSNVVHALTQRLKSPTLPTVVRHAVAPAGWQRTISCFHRRHIREHRHGATMVSLRHANLSPQVPQTFRSSSVKLNRYRQMHK